MESNPAVAAGDNPAPPPRQVRAYTLAELDALEAELGPDYGPFVPLVAATGLRPLEGTRLERRDIDRARGVLTVRGTKTAGSRREVPLTGRALAALDRLPARLDTPLLFPAPEGGPLNLDNFRRRMWTPAVKASGVERPARIYDLRSTFASNALAAGVTVFELAKMMGTSVAMIERALWDADRGRSRWDRWPTERARGRAGAGRAGRRAVSEATFDPRPFIARASWTLSRRPRTSRTGSTGTAWRRRRPTPDFRRFADLIEAEGYAARFEGIRYRYLRVDDFIYWASRSFLDARAEPQPSPRRRREGQPEHEQSSLPV